MAQQISGNDLQGWDGYIALPLTPVYGSATTFTYPADLTGILDGGDKIKVTNNGSTKYFYVLPPITFSAGSSTVTVLGGSDYSLVNSGSPVMASLYYSKMATPHGFPGWFNYSPGYNGFSVNPSGNTCRFNIAGRQVTIIHFRTAGTSNASTLGIGLPVASSGTYVYRNASGQAIDNSAAKAGPGEYDIPTGSTVANCYTDCAGAPWTATGTKTWNGLITYEF